MAGTTTDEAPPRTRKPHWWAFNSADWKNLYVSVIGGLATVLVVAIALIVNRHIGHIEVSALGYLEIAGGFAVLGILASVTNIKDKKVPVLGPLLALLFFGVGALGVLFALLLVIGEAAGVH